MFAKIPVEIFGLGLSGRELRVLGVLYAHADTDDYCWPSLDRIAELTRIGRTHIASILAALETKEVITRTRGRGGSGHPTHYRVVNSTAHGAVTTAPPVVLLETANGTVGGTNGTTGGSQTAPWAVPEPTIEPTIEPTSKERPPVVPQGTTHSEISESSLSLVRDVFAYWQKWCRPKGQLNQARTQIIQRRLKTRTVEELKSAIRGCRRRMHNSGDNANGETYFYLELILRSDQKIDMYIDALEVARKKRENGEIFERDGRLYANGTKIEGLIDLGPVNEMEESRKVEPNEIRSQGVLEKWTIQR